MTGLETITRRTARIDVSCDVVTDTTASAALLTARELDAAGRHNDAIHTLMGATRSGDLQAMSELGHRLLIGDRAPRVIPHALAFITEAARRGDGRALARVAALTAAGAHMTQDWPKALRLLGEAAAAGDEAARGQLLCLQPADPTPAGEPVTPRYETTPPRYETTPPRCETAPPRYEPGPHSYEPGPHSGETRPLSRPAIEGLFAPAAEPIDWRSLAANVPLNDWLTPAPSVPLHAKVHQIPNLVAAPVCEWLITRATGRLEPATVYDAVIKRDLVHEMRTNTLANFNYATLDVVQFLVEARMAHTCGYRLQHFEAPMILHYEVGQQITPHFDFIDANAPDYEQQIREQGQRMITFLLYLNDDYSGGETTFPKLGLSNRGKRGDGLFFINANNDRSPDRAMLHTGSPPTAGEKWIVSQFIRDIPLRP